MSRRRTSRCLPFLAAALVFWWCPEAEAQCPGLIQVGGGATLPYFCNLPLEGTHPGVRRAVVVVHGISRNAEGALQAVVDSANLAGVAPGETIVLAPLFQRTSPTAGQLFWSGDGWRDGRLSNAQTGIPRFFSYGVIDVILRQLADKVRFPSLSEVVLAGHSAGGQFMQRYAATNLIQPELKQFRFRYVVANPGTYMYLNRRRWIRGKFRTPGWFRRLLCPTWNTYRYGLRKRNGYVGQPSADEVQVQYPARRVIYLLGEADIGHTDLDRGCAAQLQGPNRFRRGQIYLDFMHEFFPANGHAIMTVPGVGHVAGDMYRSVQGQAALFLF